MRVWLANARDSSSDDMRWYARLLPGLAPAVREGSTACVIGKHMFLFGGMGGYVCCCLYHLRALYAVGAWRQYNI